MRGWLAPAVLVAALVACSGVDEAAAVGLVTRFHAALADGDWAAIDGLLSRSTRALRPGLGTARAFRNLGARHGRYLGGGLARISADDGRITLVWAARYERGAVNELFVLVDEDGGLKIDSYSDKAAP
ncbi:hypothetical protein [Sandarakinorhabdus rubra]|uniref:hypothetical protein n=1 Tax=Sandarakinorhabdus rubra TaxID=2672568 RepID=UPI0013DB6A7A|nr:hypothetical protein [Sandarakinorhabdus rubra]